MKKIAVLLLGFLSLSTAFEASAGMMYRHPLQGVTCVKKSETKFTETSPASYFASKGTSYSNAIVWNGKSVGSTYGLTGVTTFENGQKYTYSAGTRMYGRKACSGCYGATTYYYEIIKKVAEERSDTNYCSY